MRPRAIPFVLCALLVFPLGACAAQEPANPSHVYEAYFRVSPADMDEWNRIYREISIPVLTELQEEGVIEGWTEAEHSSGSDYNVRMAIRTFDWASIGTFWDEFLSRVDERQTEAESDAFYRMIDSHYDEIWEFVAANVPDDSPSQYLYASTYQVSFADMEEWTRIWTEVTGPILDQGMADGLLGGWVLLGHNTGGPHNFKVLYLFDEWDDIDDLFAALQETMAEDHPADWAMTQEMRVAHADAIWEPTPDEAE